VRQVGHLPKIITETEVRFQRMGPLRHERRNGHTCTQQGVPCSVCS